MLKTNTLLTTSSVCSHTAKTKNQLFFSLRQGLAWVGITSFIVGGISAGIWTLIPTTFLPWGASHMNLIGYISHCSFVPISSSLLFGLALFGVLQAQKRTDLKYNGLIVIGFGVAGVIIGALNTVSMSMLIFGLFGIFFGMIFIAAIELTMNKLSQKRMNNDFEPQR